MQKRPIKEQEKILIYHLLELVHRRKYFSVPEFVSDLNDDEMQSIRIVSNSQAKHLNDLIQVKYLDDDNILVLITLTESDTNELYELKFWKVYSNKLITYPIPEKVTYTTSEKIRPLC